MQRRTTQRIALISVAAGALAAMLADTGFGAPQEKSAQALASPHSEKSPAVAVTTRLVQISVIAENKRGTPVADLSENDFRLFDNGQEQKIAFFSKQTGDVQPAAVGTNPATPANTWSNEPKSRLGLPVNLTIILFDGLNTNPSDQTRARDQIIRLLSQLRPQDRVALYALGSELRILHEFTSDSSALLRVLAKHPAYEGPQVQEPSVETSNLPAATKPGDIDAVTSAAIDMFVTQPDALFRQTQTIDRVTRTTLAMEAIAAHLAGLPGRKSLLWVSGAFPLHLENQSLTVAGSTPTDQRTFTEQLGRAARALQDANVAVYPVDARGLNSNTIRGFSNGSGNVPGRTPLVGPPSAPASRGPSTLAPNQEGLGTMEEIAARTGGVAFYFTNDIRGALRQAMDDSRVVYTLAYVPAHEDWKGEFRKVKVEVNRKDVRLRYRSGYFAIPDTPLDGAQQQRLLAEAQWSPFEATQLALKVEAGRMDSGGKPAMRFTLVADASEVRFAEVSAEHAADLVVAMAEKSIDGRIVHGETKQVSLRLQEEKYREVVAGGVRLAGTLPLDPAANQLRFTLLDAGTGRIGSVDIPLAEIAGPATTALGAAPSGTSSPAEKQKP